MKKLIVMLTTLCVSFILTLNVSAKNNELTVGNELINPKIKVDIYVGENVTLPKDSEYAINDNKIVATFDSFSQSQNKIKSNEIKEFCNNIQLKKTGYYISDIKICKIKSKVNFLSLKTINEDINVTIKLIWSPNKATVKYNLNGGNVKNTNLSISEKEILVNKKNSVYTQEFVYGEKYDELLNEKIDIYKKDYVFVGWSTNQNGNKLIYANQNAENMFKNLSKENQDIVLYAQWMPKDLKIVYKNPDGKSKVFTYTYKKNINYITKGNIYDVNKQYCSFMGWSTKSDGKGAFIKFNSAIPYTVILSNIKNGKLYLYPVLNEYVLPVSTNASHLYVSSPYGYRNNPVGKGTSFHYGIDLAAPTGTNIFASSDGVVVESKYSSGYGLYVTIRHYDGRQTRYAHCNEILVNEGDRVKSGQVIAKVGNTGQSTGSHLHFEMIINNERLNPEDYVDFSKLKR